MTDKTRLFVAAVAPDARDREPLQGTRLFAVLASSGEEAVDLVRRETERPDADITLREDAPSRLYAERLPLRERAPVEFSLEDRG